MWCPKCAENTSVKATVKDEEYHRLRYCSWCGYVFQTIEAPINSIYWKDYKNEIEEVQDAVS